jgi:nitrous oxide reductase accessory protein NosL
MVRDVLRPLLGLTFAVAVVLVISSSRAPGQSAEPHQPTERDACPVCGMFVSPHPEWLAQIVFDDGSVLFFDGCKDLFKYLVARDRFAPDKRDLDPAVIFVTSYYDGTPLPARNAHFVIGSDAHGPMGVELVPHPTAEAADEFLRDHSGSRVVRFDDVTAKLLDSLG